MRGSFNTFKRLSAVLFCYIAFTLITNASSCSPQTHVTPSPQNSPCYQHIGVSLSGAEWDDITYRPTVRELHYYSAKGIKIIRLSLRWDRLQPALLGPLNRDEIMWVKSYLEQADKLHISMIIDLHLRTVIDDLNFKPGTALPPEALVDLWGKLSTALRSVPGLCAYDIANEPNHVSGYRDLWAKQANAVIQSIRKIDTTHYIFVNEDDWTPSDSWKAGEAEQITDPEHLLVYEAHSYWDSDESGHYTPNIPPHDTTEAKTRSVNNLAPFINWCGTTYRCFVGEFGVPSNQTWLVSLDAALHFMKDHHIAGTYWAGGPGWRDDHGNDYPLSIEPYPDGTDKPQMKVLEKYL